MTNKTQQIYRADDETINAIASALGALAMSVAHTMNAEQRLAMAEALDRAALQAEAQNDWTQRSLIARMHMMVYQPLGPG